MASLYFNAVPLLPPFFLSALSWERVFCHLRSVSTQARGPSPGLLKKTLMVFTPLSNPEHLKLCFSFFIFHLFILLLSFLSAHYFSFYIYLIPFPSISLFPPVLCVSFPNSHDPFLCIPSYSHPPFLSCSSLCLPSSFPLFPVILCTSCSLHFLCQIAFPHTVYLKTPEHVMMKLEVTF